MQNLVTASSKLLLVKSNKGKQQGQELVKKDRSKLIDSNYIQIKDCHRSFKVKIFVKIIFTTSCGT